LAPTFDFSPATDRLLADKITGKPAEPPKQEEENMKRAKLVHVAELLAPSMFRPSNAIMPTVGKVN